MQHRVRPGIALLLFLFMFSHVNAEDAPVQERYVARAAFTSRIVNREPVDEMVVVKPPISKVYFFTDLRNLQGHTITHRWQYNEKIVSQVPFVVDGDRWRVYSRFELPPGSYGEWSVTVVEESGWPLYIELFRYEPADTDARRRNTGLPKDFRAVIPEAPLSE